MRSAPRALIFVGALALATSAAVAGTVTVSSVDPERFGDAGSTSAERAATLRELTRHLQALGQRYLPADQPLSVEILDVDLAGTSRPRGRTGMPVRVVLDADTQSPRFELRYTLSAAGRAPVTRQESLSGLDVSRGLTGTGEADPLHAEKRVLEDWFKARFAQEHAPGN